MITSRGRRGAPAPARRIRVLYVDGDPTARSVFDAALSAADPAFTVETAADVEAALSALDGVDCVVSAYELAGSDGLEFLRTVRRQYPSVPFILDPGRDAENVVSEAVAAGVTDCLWREGGSEEYALLANRIHDAVGRRRADERLAHREELLVRTQRMAKVGSWELDAETGTLRMSDEAARILGFEPGAEPDVERVLDRCHPDDRASVEAALERARRGDRSDVVARVRTGERDSHVRVLCESADTASEVAVRGTAQDVTERATLESRLGANEAAFRRLYETTTRADESFEARLGEALDIGRDYLGVDYAFVSSPMDQLFTVLIERGDHPELTQGHVVPPSESPPRGRGFDDGSHVAHDVADSPLADDPAIERLGLSSYLGRAVEVDGSVQAVVCFGGETPRDRPFTESERVFVDLLARWISFEFEREAAAEQREALERNFDAVFDSSLTFGAIFTPDGTLVEVNEMTLTITGMEAGDVLGRPMWETPFWSGPEMEAARADLRDAVTRAARGETVYLEVDFMAGSHKRQALAVFNPVVHGERVARIVGTAFDVTELREKERELQAHNERLEQFARTLTHDLRNPLSVAIGRIDLVRERNDDPELEPHLDAVDRGHTRMAAIIEDLLTLAREGEGEFVPLDLGGVVEDAWAVVGESTARLSVVEPLGTVVCEESGVRRLFENLLANAVEHGGADVAVRVGPLADGFFVEDDGEGISADRREKVFEDGVSSNPGGTGYGLSIVREVANTHGWSVEATASEIGGARFEFTGVERDPSAVGHSAVAGDGGTGRGP